MEGHTQWRDVLVRAELTLVWLSSRKEVLSDLLVLNIGLHLDVSFLDFFFLQELHERFAVKEHVENLFVSPNLHFHSRNFEAVFEVLVREYVLKEPFSGLYRPYSGVSNMSMPSTVIFIFPEKVPCSTMSLWMNPSTEK